MTFIGNFAVRRAGLGTHGTLGNVSSWGVGTERGLAIDISMAVPYTRGC